MSGPWFDVRGCARALVALGSLGLTLAACSSGAVAPVSSVPLANAALAPRSNALALNTGTQPGASPALTRGFSVLHTFSGCPGGSGPGGDGANPVGGVYVDAAGDIFGTTYAGGATCQSNALPGYGTVYVLKPSGASYAEKIVYTFDGANGAWPEGRPALDACDNLFVTTSAGGPSQSNGTAYKFSPSASGYVVTGSNTFSSVASQGGNGPEAPLLQLDGRSVLYGTTYAQGGAAPNNFGSIFALSSSGLAETDLYDFAGGTNDGSYPSAHLVADASGALYGTTTQGGTYGYGTVFKFVPSGAGGSETVIWNFANGSDGAFPKGGVVLDEAGNLYGTTQEGGTPGYGTVFKLKPTPSGYVEKILYAFTGDHAGSPYASLVRNGTMLYGTTTYGGGGGCTTCGSIFQISTTGTQFALLHLFHGAGDGAQPFFSPLFWDGKALYGTTEYGGNSAGASGNGQGVVFRYVP